MVKGRGEVLAMEEERKKEREGLQVYNTQNQAVRFSLVSTNERANMAARTNGSGTGSSHAKNIRCHHCAGPLSKEMETGKWTVPPLIRDSFSMIGSAVGGTASAFYGFNLVMPVVQRRVKGPMWLHFLVCAPPVIVFSSACAGLAGGATPALAQLASTSYHAIMSSPPSEDEKIQKSRTSSTL